MPHLIRETTIIKTMGLTSSREIYPYALILTNRFTYEQELVCVGSKDHLDRLVRNELDLSRAPLRFRERGRLSKYVCPNATTAVSIAPVLALPPSIYGIQLDPEFSLIMSDFKTSTSTYCACKLCDPSP